MPARKAKNTRTKKSVSKKTRKKTPAARKASTPVRKKKVAVRVRKRREPEWAEWEDAELLGLRFCDLGVSVEQSTVGPRIEQLYVELEQRGFRFRPHFWFSTTWFCPDGVPGVAMPFYLMHPRLIQLQRKMTGDVEGGSKDECIRLLRHEVGHALDHAYLLHRRRRWQQLFGKSSKPYPSFYNPSPFSKRYVVHLDDWYAQAHPDEDFAETFAVWLTPRSQWYARYRNWPALRKLEYVDDLMRQIMDQKPKVSSRARVEPLTHDRRTLAEHYKEYNEEYDVAGKEIYDLDLNRLFSDKPEHARNQSAAAFLKDIERDIRRLVSSWSSEYRYNLKQVFDEMVERCRELKLRVAGPQDRLKVDFAIVLALHALNYLQRGRVCIMM